jgi:hypothetical protein
MQDCTQVWGKTASIASRMPSSQAGWACVQRTSSPTAATMGRVSPAALRRAAARLDIRPAGLARWDRDRRIVERIRASRADAALPGGYGRSRAPAGHSRPRCAPMWEDRLHPQAEIELLLALDAAYYTPERATDKRMAIDPFGVEQAAFIVHHAVPEGFRIDEEELRSLEREGLG